MTVEQLAEALRQRAAQGDLSWASGSVMPVCKEYGVPVMTAQAAIRLAMPSKPQPEQEPYLDKLRAALVDSAGLDAIGEPEPLIKDILQKDSIAWLQGRPGNGKSFVALDIAGCVGTGETWQGYPATRGPVLYLAAEGVSGVRNRVRAWESSMGHSMDNVTFLPMAVQASERLHWDALVTLATEMKPLLVVIDTQARVTVGMEENSAKDMGVFVERIEQLRRATGACVLVVHHQGRTGEHMRGSTALEGAATTIIGVEKKDDDITVENKKQKDAPEFDSFHLRLVSYGSSAILAPNDHGAKDHPERLRKQPWLQTWRDRFGANAVGVTEAVKAGVVSESTFHYFKFKLVEAGIMVKEGTEHRPKYRLLIDPSE